MKDSQINGLNDAETRRTHIAGRYQVLAAIGGVIAGYLLSFFLLPSSNSFSNKNQPLITQIELTRQRVNDKGHALDSAGREIEDSLNLPLNEKDELATFRFTIYNSTEDLVEITSGLFSGTPPTIRHYESEQLTNFPLIGHKNHIDAWFEKNHTASFPINLQIPAGESRDLTIWFRVKNPTSYFDKFDSEKNKHDDVWTYKTSGQVSFIYDGGIIQSKKIDILVHSPMPSWEELRHSNE